MAKRLIVCCDGTWNRPDQIESGLAAPTNVAKIALAVPREGPGGTPQLLHYHPGVGTRRFERLRGGGFGFVQTGGSEAPVPHRIPAAVH